MKYVIAFVPNLFFFSSDFLRITLLIALLYGFQIATQDWTIVIHRVSFEEVGKFACDYVNIRLPPCSFVLGKAFVEMRICRAVLTPTCFDCSNDFRYIFQ